MKTYLIMVAVKPGTKPPGRTVSCSQCMHWHGRTNAPELVGDRCALLPGLWPADFGCAYFMRRAGGVG